MIIDHNFHAMIVVIIYEILVFMDEIFIHTFFMTPSAWHRHDHREGGQRPHLDLHLQQGGLEQGSCSRGLLSQRIKYMTVKSC